MPVAQKAPTYGQPESQLCGGYEAGAQHWTSDATADAGVHYAASGPMSEAALPAATIPQAFLMAVEANPTSPALRVERPLPPLNADGTAPPSAPLESWKTWTFAEYYEDSRRVARGMLSLGFEQFGTATIFGFNAPEWHMSAMAAMMAGGKPAGIYPTDTPEVLAYKTNHSDATIAVVEDQSKFDKYASIAGELTGLKAIVCWGFQPQVSSVAGANGDIKVMTFLQLLEAGEPSAEAPGGGTLDELLDARIAAIKPGNCAALIYTSGTTGNPKAVMASHDNFFAEAAGACSLIEDLYSGGQQERIISYLPLSHVAGMMCDIVMPCVGTAKFDGYATVHFARPYDLKASTIGDRLRAVKPTLFLGIPRVWEKIADKIRAIGRQTKGLKRKIAVWAKGRGLKYQQRLQMGGNGRKPKGYGFANKKVLSVVKARLGLEHCKYALTSAAPIGRDTLEYFGSLGICICEAYGMSECTGVTTFSNNSAHLWGSCGWSMPGFETKVFNVDATDLNKKTECPQTADVFASSEEQEGELCYRGRHIMMGYYANPKFGEEHVAEIAKKNREAIDSDGFLHSGDKGCCDTRGNLKITGRYKELIIGSGGENIAPVPIEDEVKRLCPAVSNFMMVGDKRKYNVALVTLKAEGANGEVPGGDVLDAQAAALDPEGKITSIRAAMDSNAFIDAITDAIKKTNATGSVCPSNAAKIQKFTILPTDFSQETGELTPTLKTKRSVIEKKFAAAIDAMYGPEVTTAAYVKVPEEFL